MGFWDKFQSKRAELAGDLSADERHEANEYLSLIGDAKKAQVKWQELGSAMIAHLDSSFSPHFNTEEQISEAHEEFQANFRESIKALDKADEVWKDMNHKQREFCKASCDAKVVTSGQAIMDLDTYHKPVKGQALSSILKTIVTRDLSHVLGENYFTERSAEVKKELEKEYEELNQALEEEMGK